MNYEDDLLSFVRRTRKNLRLTDQWRQQHLDAGFSEVTHLVNSLLGLIVLPKDRVLNDLRQVRVEPTGIREWGVSFRLERVTGELPSELRPFLIGLRNSVAHSSIEFASDGVELSGVSFVERGRDKTRTVLWRAIFELDALRSFLDHLTDEVEKACSRRTTNAALRS